MVRKSKEKDSKIFIKNAIMDFLREIAEQMKGTTDKEMKIKTRDFYIRWSLISFILVMLIVLSLLNKIDNQLIAIITLALGYLFGGGFLKKN